MFLINLATLCTFSCDHDLIGLESTPEKRCAELCMTRAGPSKSELCLRKFLAEVGVLFRGDPRIM